MCFYDQMIECIIYWDGEKQNHPPLGCVHFSIKKKNVCNLWQDRIPTDRYGGLSDLHMPNIPTNSSCKGIQWNK